MQPQLHCAAFHSFMKFCLSGGVSMNANLFYLCGYIAFSLPFLAIAATLVHYCIRRATWKRKKRCGVTSPGFCPSSSTLGMVLLFAQMFYRPTVSYVLEARQDEDVEEDDQGDPETITKQLSRQLKRIRRGEPVGDLVLRL
jgi:hypothetical protein